MKLRFQKYKLLELSLLAVYAALIYLREPRFFLQPRFWAEEGTTHFYFAYSLHWFPALWHPVKGYLNFWANFSTVLAARLVPLEHAPLVTTLMAFLVQVLLGAWIVTTPLAIANRWYKKAAMLAIVLVVPVTSEIWLNSINSMEFLCVITFLILIESTQQARFRRSAGYVLLALGGLSGLDSLLLAPFFFLRAWREKSRPRTVQTLILAGCGLVQLAIVLSASGMGSLAYRFAGINSLGLRTMVIIFFTQSIGLLIAGFNQMTALAVQLSLLDAANPFALKLVTLAILLFEIAFLVYLTLKLPPQERLFYAGSYLWLIMALVFFSIDRDKSPYMTPGYGHRHFFAANAILGFLILANLDGSPGRRWKFRSLFAAALLGLALFWGAIQFEPTLYRYPGWPSWPDQVAAWRLDPTRSLLIWPETWKMYLKPHG